MQLLALWLGIERAAFAQSCHAAAQLPTAEPGFALDAGAEFTRFATARAEGHYEALSLSGTLQQTWGQVQASGAAYRILHNGLTQRGIGDLSLASRFVVWNEPTDAGQLGVQFALHAPTGDPAKQLGMGHWMVMPGVWWQVGSPTRYLLADVTYGRSLVTDSGHHHHSAGPIVAPMNASELNLSLRTGLQVHAHTDLRASAALALPLAAAGAYRAAACLALAAHPAQLLASLESCVPLVGDAFEWKVRTSVGWRF